MVLSEAILCLLKGDYVQGAPLRMIKGISRVQKAGDFRCGGCSLGPAPTH